MDWEHGLGLGAPGHLDDKANGLKDEDLSELKRAYLDTVVPRYLKPLTSAGRSIQPCLIHSNLWPGNAKMMEEKDQICIFDACAYWGHNEGQSAQRAEIFPDEELCSKLAQNKLKSVAKP